MSKGGLHVDHLVWCVPDLDAGVAALERLTGVRAAPGGRHPGVGTHNALLSLGARSYIEIIAPDPVQDDYRTPRVFRLDDIEAPTLVTWSAPSASLRDLAGTSFNDGQRLGDAHSMSRVRPDGVELSWTMTDPYAVVDHGLVPFLIDWADSPHPGETAPAGVSLLGLEAWHPEADAVNDRLSRLGIGLEVESDGAPRHVAVLDSPRGRVDLS